MFLVLLPKLPKLRLSPVISRNRRRSGRYRAVVALLLLAEAAATFGVVSRASAQIQDSAILATASESWRDTVVNKRAIYLSGGIELGRAVASVAGDSNALVLSSPRQPATTVSADAFLAVPYLQLIGQAGVSFTRAERGQFGRFLLLVNGEASPSQLPWWQVGSDFTAVGSTLAPGTMSAGFIARLGRIDRLQGGIRVGGRWRQRVGTAVTTLDGAHVSSFQFRRTLIAVGVSAALTVTERPDGPYVAFRPVPSGTTLAILYPYMATGLKEQTTLGDFMLRVRGVRGSWEVGGSAVARAGRSVNVWDDPVPEANFLQSNSGHYAARGRIAWTPVQKLTIVAEGGRQLSDPMFGLSGVHYATLAVRFNFQTIYDKSLVQSRIPGVASSSVANVLTVDPVADAEGERQLVFQNVAADTIEIAADFTQWQPVRLSQCTDSAHTPIEKAAKSIESSGGPQDVHTWCGRFRLPPGVYHVIYRCNGGEWRVPGGLPVVNDTFGGQVGLLIVPGM